MPLSTVWAFAAPAGVSWSLYLPNGTAPVASSPAQTATVVLNDSVTSVQLCVDAGHGTGQSCATVALNPGSSTTVRTNEWVAVVTPTTSGAAGQLWTLAITAANKNDRATLMGLTAGVVVLGVLAIVFVVLFVVARSQTPEAVAAAQRRKAKASRRADRRAAALLEYGDDVSTQDSRLFGSAM